MLWTLFSNSWTNSVMDYLYWIFWAYLDDIVVLSPTFEQHIEDLKIVFNRLLKFKLCVNREKCKFACSRVKYLGLWITPNEIEVEQDKIAAIKNIPCLRNAKQLQSFLKICLWYRKFIPNFSDISRTLSNLTNNTAWKWVKINMFSWLLRNT